MKHPPPHPSNRSGSALLKLALLGFLLPCAQSGEQGWETCITKGQYLHSSYETKPGAGGRHYERDRRVDVKHLKLDLTPDFNRQSMASITTLTFSPIAKPLDQLRLDAVNRSARGLGQR